MEYLQQQLAAVQARLNAERELGGQKDADKIAVLEGQEADLTRRIMEQAQQERVQAQEEKVAAVTLPYDFNDILSDEDYKNAQGQPHRITVANDMIIEVVQEFQRQANAESNEEVKNLIATHKEEIRELQEILENAKRQVLEITAERDLARSEIHQANLDRDDMTFKRDAAVRELEEANTRIEKLEAQIANIPVTKAAIDVSATDKLAQLVKESNEAKALRGLARWAEMLPEVVTAPVLPSLVENSAEVATLSPEIPSVGNDFRNAEISGGLDGSEGRTDQGVSEVTRVEFEELRARVDILFANQDRREVA